MNTALWHWPQWGMLVLQSVWFLCSINDALKQPDLSKRRTYLVILTAVRAVLVGVLYAGGFWP